jgi:hypothetical protein
MLDTANAIANAPKMTPKIGFLPAVVTSDRAGQRPPAIATVKTRQRFSKA